MPYTTQKDIEIAAGGSTPLIALTDQTGINTEVDLDVLAIYQARADAFLNGYLRLLYATPLAIPSREIIDCAAELTVYFLRTKPGQFPLTEHDVKAHELRIKWLEDVRAGRIRIDNIDPPKSAAVASAVIELGGSFTRERLNRR